MDDEFRPIMTIDYPEKLNWTKHDVRKTIGPTDAKRVQIDNMN